VVIYFINFCFNRIMFRLFKVNKEGVRGEVGPRDAFTVVELIVAMGLFMTVIVVAIGAYIQVIKTQGIVTDVMAANDNASLVMEQMAREMRTGRQFTKSDDGLQLAFRNDVGRCVLYKFAGSAIVRAEISQDSCGNGEYPPTELLTAPTVDIKDGMFTLAKNVSGGRGIAFDEIGISFKINTEGGFFNDKGNLLKTTVSARKYFSND